MAVQSSGMLRWKQNQKGTSKARGVQLSGGNGTVCYPAPIFQSKTFVLSELRLENYAVIDNVAVEFASGLNLLTGETGRGSPS